MLGMLILRFFSTSILASISQPVLEALVAISVYFPSAASSSLPVWLSGVEATVTGASGPLSKVHVKEYVSTMLPSLSEAVAMITPFGLTGSQLELGSYVKLTTGSMWRSEMFTRKGTVVQPAPGFIPDFRMPTT